MQFCLKTINIHWKSRSRPKQLQKSIETTNITRAAKTFYCFGPLKKVGIAIFLCLHYTEFKKKYFLLWALFSMFESRWKVLGVGWILFRRKWAWPRLFFVLKDRPAIMHCHEWYREMSARFTLHSIVLLLLLVIPMVYSPHFLRRTYSPSSKVWPKYSRTSIFAKFLYKQNSNFLHFSASFINWIEPGD